MTRIRRRWVVAILAVLAVTAGAHHWSRRVTPAKIATGRVLFEHEWKVDDPLAGGDGLGPVFNAKSCVECHFQGGIGGGGPNKHNVTAFEVVTDKKHGKVPGGVVHKFATSDLLIETQDRVRELFPIIPGGRRVVRGCTITTPDFDPVLFTSINTPPLFGAGLIDNISDLSIQANGAKRTLMSVSNELDGDMTSVAVGRVHGVSGSVGKFGWKGQFAKLEDFVAAACAVELGLSNPHRQQDLPRNHQPDRDAKLDISGRQFRELVAFVANLPAPREVIPSDPQQRDEAVRGKGLFVTIGCAECHTPNLGGVKGVYSDFRLYRIELENEQGVYSRVGVQFKFPFNHPKPNEWKTPPLWGVADSAPYFHDGRSATLGEAILRHDLAAKKSRVAYEGLSRIDRQSVIAFLKTLRSPLMH